MIELSKAQQFIAEEIAKTNRTMSNLKSEWNEIQHREYGRSRVAREKRNEDIAANIAAYEAAKEYVDELELALAAILPRKLDIYTAIQAAAMALKES
jgi:hypothetical protein